MATITTGIAVQLLDAWPGPAWIMDADLYEHLNATITQSPSQKDVQLSASTHAVEEGDATDQSQSNRERTTSNSLPQEIDQIFTALTTSPWAARLGNLVGSVKKQV